MKLLKSGYLFLLVNLLSAPALNAATNKQDGHTLGHYIVHTVVQGAGGVAIGAASTLGTMAGIGIAAAAPREESLAAVAGIATILGSIGGGVYSMYRLPQWTDSYFLGYKGERTRAQNMICFLSKIFLWPVGVLAGEFVAHLDNFAPENNK